MNKIELKSSALDQIPDNFRYAILGDKKVTDLWQDIDPLARNEWIYWIIDTKKQ